MRTEQFKDCVLALVASKLVSPVEVPRGRVVQGVYVGSETIRAPSEAVEVKTALPQALQ